MKRDKSKPAKATDSHKAAARAIPQQNGFLETVLESLTHPFYVIDANDYTIKMANSAARLGRITGAATCYALTHRADKPCAMDVHPCPLAIVKSTRQPTKVEHAHYDKDGNTRIVEVHGFPIFDNAGRVAQVIEYCLDITERKRTEQALRESEQQYRSFVQNFQGILYQGYLNFVPVFFHGAVEEITGYKESEFLAGRRRWDQVIHPADLPGISETARKVRVTPGYGTKREYRSVRSATGFTYQLSDVAGLEPGTYTVFVQTRFVNNPAGVGLLNFQVGTDGEEPKICTNCTDCHDDTRMHGSYPFNPDLCKNCHDYQNQLTGKTGWNDSNWGFGAAPFARRVHGVHFGHYLHKPEEVHGDRDAEHFGGIIFPQDVRNCTKCHADNPAWIQEPSRVACLACHDSDAAIFHGALMTFDLTSSDPYGGDEVETCIICHGEHAAFSPDQMHNISDPYKPPYLRDPEGEGH